MWLCGIEIRDDGLHLVFKISRHMPAVNCLRVERGDGVIVCVLVVCKGLSLSGIELGEAGRLYTMQSV